MLRDFWYTPTPWKSLPWRCSTVRVGQGFATPYTEIEDGPTPTPPNKKWMGFMCGSLELGLFCLVWLCFDDFLSVFVHANVVGRCFVALFLGGYFVFGSDSKSRKNPLSVNSHLPLRKVNVKQTTWQCVEQRGPGKQLQVAWNICPFIGWYNPNYPFIRPLIGVII